MEIVNVAVFLGLAMFCGGSWAQEPFLGDWTKGLLEQVQRINEDVRRNVQNIDESVRRNVQNIDLRVQEQVRAELARIDDLRDKVVEDAERRAANPTANGDGIVVSANGGTSRSVYSGRTSNGEPYFRDVEQRIAGDTLYRFLRYYDPETKMVKEEAYRLNLTDPAAKFVPIATDTSGK